MLWGSSASITPSDFVSALPTQVDTIMMVMQQCYSGAFITPFTTATWTGGNQNQKTVHNDRSDIESIFLWECLCHRVDFRDYEWLSLDEECPLLMRLIVTQQKPQKLRLMVQDPGPTLQQCISLTALRPCFNNRENPEWRRVLAAGNIIPVSHYMEPDGIRLRRHRQN